jgi:hypothetical protein
MAEWGPFLSASELRKINMIITMNLKKIVLPLIINIKYFNWTKRET